MALSPHGGTPMGPSELDASGGFELPDVDSLDTAAANLTTHSAAFRSGLDAAARTWSGLGSSYVSEESPTVLAAFTRVSPLAASVSQDAQLTSKALSTFSATCRDLRHRLEAYGHSVWELDSDIAAFPTSVEKTTMVKGEQITTQVKQSWQGDAGLTARRNELAAEIEAIHNDYLNAQDTCATAIAAVSGAEVHRSERLQHADFSTGNWITEALFNAGTFFGIQNEQDQNPWGKQTVPYRLNGVLGEMQGFGAGAVMLVDGVWSLLPVLSNKAKNDSAMAGIRTLFTNPGSIDPGDAWAGIIHAKEAETNAGWAAGANVFGLASLLIPGLGVGKAGTVVSKAGQAAEKISIATMDSSRLGRLSAGMGSAAQGLYGTGAFLSKPGSLALKVSDLVMPQTTAKVMDTITAMKVNAWMALDKLPVAVDHATARASDGLASVMRATDQALEQVFPAVAPAGVSGLGQGSLGRMADSLSPTGLADHVSAGGRAPAGHAPGTATTPQPGTPVEHFPKPESIERTIILERGHRNFPVSLKDNFAARTGLEPNTEYVVEHRSRMNQVTGKAADSVETYYTDATGRVVRVDTYAGIRGAWSPELNKPVPNVTYNVVAKVDGGLENTFTYTTDAAGHATSVSGRVTSTFAGHMNRNAWQQLLAGRRVGGTEYEGGHSSPSFLGAPGERIGLFAQHQFQNRGKGKSNVGDGGAKFYLVEDRIMEQVKQRLQSNQSLDLSWSMSTPSGRVPGLPDTIRLEHWFDDEDSIINEFSNLP
jgi:hypothetical protein